MKARAKWVEGMAFMGEAGSGHGVIMDGAPEYGGRNIGIRPMEMLLIGLAGCTGFDVVQILKKGREVVTGCEVEVEAERAEKPPKVFTRIHLHYRVSGDGLSPKQVERAVSLSKDKYCSASIMLAKSAELTHEVTLDGALEDPASG